MSVVRSEGREGKGKRVDYRRLVDSEDETSMFPVSSATRALMRATRDSIAIINISKKTPSSNQASTYFLLRSSLHHQSCQSSLTAPHSASKNSAASPLAQQRSS